MDRSLIALKKKVASQQKRLAMIARKYPAAFTIKKTKKGKKTPKKAASEKKTPKKKTPKKKKASKKKGSKAKGKSATK
jgi:hypothetical protein